MKAPIVENFQALEGPRILTPWGAIREEIEHKKIFFLTCQKTIGTTSVPRQTSDFFNFLN